MATQEAGLIHVCHTGPSPVPHHTESSGASIVQVGGTLAREEAGELWQKGGLQEGSQCGRLDYGCFLVSHF